jgi:D-alanine--poly(phosphoribitol) ligase subunit 1
MLREQLAKAFVTHADLIAIRSGDVEISYRELWEQGAALAEDFMGSFPPGPIGLLGSKQFCMYSGILGAVISGRAYVPLNEKFPAERLGVMARTAGCVAILYESSGRALLNRIVSEIDSTVDQCCFTTVAEDLSGTRVCLLELSRRGVPASPFREDFVYILFTSGSTGRPKGIGITQGNLESYLGHAIREFGVLPGDRASQMFDLSFDLSVHDIFVTWLGGGCLCIPTPQDQFAPGRFIVKQEISHWFSVPSTVSLLSRLRNLRTNAFPLLRQSLFCGEALPVDLARQWFASAPNSTIFNLYGPTEATIAISAHAIDQRTLDFTQTPSVVPLGRIFPGHEFRISRDSASYREDDSGELLVSGPQVSPGYLADPEKTLSVFVKQQGASEDRIWYRTGDRVRADEGGVLHYLGRLDSQIQVHGHRVELGEVEGALRRVSGGRVCSAIAWPRFGDTVEGIVAFVEGSDGEGEALLMVDELRGFLPSYMVPSEIRYVPVMPLNANGKIDRNALGHLLQ